MDFEVGKHPHSFLNVVFSLCIVKYFIIMYNLCLGDMQKVMTGLGIARSTVSMVSAAAW